MFSLLINAIALGPDVCMQCLHFLCMQCLHFLVRLLTFICPSTYTNTPQTASPSSAVASGGAANGYDCLKPRPPAPVPIPPLDSIPPFLFHPSTNPYVETPTAKHPSLTSYDLTLRDSGQGSSSETIGQELEQVDSENSNHNNNETNEIETNINTVDITLDINA